MDLRGKCVYLSGPMTGLPDFNREAFREAATYLRNQGAYVFNPAFNPPGKSYEQYMTRDINELTSHKDGKPFYDVLAQLPGWEKSRGAKVEWIVALACGMEVIAV